LAIGGCAEAPDAAGPAPRSESLPPGVVARVADMDIADVSVARIAARQDLSLSEARHRAIHDALFAAQAREALPAYEVDHASRSVLARALLKTIWQEVRKPPISAAELEDATARHWTELDRPKALRSVHAVVQVDASSAPRRDEGRALAEAIRAALQPVAAEARSKEAPASADGDPELVFHRRTVDPVADAFTKAARAVPAEGWKVTVEELPPIAVDMRVVEQGAPPDYRPLDETFCRAALALESRGELSEVVETAFGFHVIMALATIPERRLPEAERRATLRDEILRRRARNAEGRLLGRLAGQSGVEIATNAPSLMELVRTREESSPLASDEAPP
jgi:hypothetical protein